MNSTDRVVTQIPTTELWDPSGAFGRRLRYLTFAELRDLLRVSTPSFAVAEVGKPLTWVLEDQRFAFWKRVSSHVIRSEPVTLADYPGSLAYMPSEWSGRDGTTVVLLEAWH